MDRAQTRTRLMARTKSEKELIGARFNLTRVHQILRLGPGAHHYHCVGVVSHAGGTFLMRGHVFEHVFTVEDVRQTAIPHHSGRKSLGHRMCAAAVDGYYNYHPERRV